MVTGGLIIPEWVWVLESYALCCSFVLLSVSHFVVTCMEYGFPTRLYLSPISAPCICLFYNTSVPLNVELIIPLTLQDPYSVDKDLVQRQIERAQLPSGNSSRHAHLFHFTKFKFVILSLFVPFASRVLYSGNIRSVIPY